MIVIHHSRQMRSFRVVWMLEEMGLPYEVRAVRLGSPKDEDFLSASPTGMAPLLEDGDVRMVESVGMLEYLGGRYGPTPLVVPPQDGRYPAYLQFLHFGESSLGAFLTPVVATRFMAPDDQKENWGTEACKGFFLRRLAHLLAPLERGPWLTGEEFTAADIAVGYSLRLGVLLQVGDYPRPVTDYLDRLKTRPAYQRAEAV